MRSKPLLPRLLFWLGCLCAGSLFGLVLIAPLLPSGEMPRALSLFATDSVVRRTAIISGLGLFATACIFFRPSPEETSGA